MTTDSSSSSAVGQTAWEYYFTEAEKRILAPKLIGVKDANKITAAELKTAAELFNEGFTLSADTKTAALVTGIANFIDNAGGRSNSEVWQQIKHIQKAWVGDDNGVGI